MADTSGSTETAVEAATAPSISQAGQGTDGVPDKATARATQLQSQASWNRLQTSAAPVQDRAAEPKMPAARTARTAVSRRAAADAGARTRAGRRSRAHRW